MVQGRLTPVGADGREPLYTARLRVDDEVHCPGEAVQYRGHRVELRAVPRAGVVHAVEAAAAMTGVVESRRCALAAQFDVTGSATRLLPVAPACTEPVRASGGGPGIISDEEAARQRRDVRRWGRSAEGFDPERNMPVIGTRLHK
jgi:hypothetical protein